MRPAVFALTVCLDGAVIRTPMHDDDLHIVLDQAYIFLMIKCPSYPHRQRVDDFKIIDIRISGILMDLGVSAAPLTPSSPRNVFEATK